MSDVDDGMTEYKNETIDALLALRGEIFWKLLDMKFKGQGVITTMLEEMLGKAEPLLAPPHA